MTQYEWTPISGGFVHPGQNLGPSGHGTTRGLNCILTGALGVTCNQT